MTLFPKMFDGPLSESLLAKAAEAGILDVRIHSLRNWSDDPRHQKVDDRPYGGGAGMLIRPEPVYRAIKALAGRAAKGKRPRVIFMSPRGRRFNQAAAKRLAKVRHLVLLCGRYEGVDERALSFVDEEISIGDFILTGGEIPALAVVDAVARLIPGVVGHPESIERESFADGRLEHSHYTRPANWRGKRVPDVLLSGNHKAIAAWRDAESTGKTRKSRPDLLAAARRKPR